MVSTPLRLNDPLPLFSPLPGTDGARYAATDFRADVLVIVFSCNHCPYVQAYEERMIALQRDYAQHMQLVAVNSNDEANYPDDSFEKMVERAAGKAFNFVYLRDADQRVASTFGATHTPQFFVFDQKRILRYLGKLDDNWKEPGSVTTRYVRDALDAILAGRKVELPETHSIGCTIKWKSS